MLTTSSVHSSATCGPAAADSPAPAAARPSFALAAGTLWRRELVRFFRQRNRVIGALGTPAVFWLLLGSGLDQAFVTELAGQGGEQSVGYLAYFFPGTLLLILLFTAVFSTFSVIEDRREGFLQGVLVSPAPRAAIVLGKVLGGASIAALQGLVFAAAWPLVGVWPGWLAMLGLAGAMFLVAIGLTGLSLCLAWRMDSTAGFHAVMNLLLMPMWFLCGAVFPVATAPLWMQIVMYLNPLTYGHAVLTSLLFGAGGAGASLPLPIGMAWGMLVLLAAVPLLLCSRIAARADA